MDTEAHIKALEGWISYMEFGATEMRDIVRCREEISNALYAFSELGMFPDGIQIKSLALAARVWAVVETVRRIGFPEHLGM